ncbi:hypothetical protein [Nocardioides sp. Soil796]|uniref:hypothetical protein n=1 Tax=Nocardioides sp. Soil796 TaxID=1736412 RepID=UPI000708B352|nr:hypothetical protein [Nocardioides sp. Soil796]KRF14628.1 hypothetical protein ASH02_09975 [Nocardioides sp. Soil796]
MGADELAESFDGFVETIGRLADELRDDELYSSPENRASAHRFLLGMTIARLEEHVLFEPDFPFFRVLDTRIREGGDNSDQRYLISRLNPGETYRIWGTLGDAQRLEVQIYAGDPYLGSGRMASYLAAEDLQVREDGTFEVIASSVEQPGNWLENPADATRVLVRQIYSDWASAATPGEVHIDRVGHEGDLRPALQPDDLAARLREATSDLVAQARAWPALVKKGYLDASPNTLSEPFDPGSRGGVPGRWMVRGNFALGDDEAMVITAWPGSGDYQGIQLLDPWFSSLEYANRQTSLSGDQAHRDADGAYRFVVSARDPGVPNWLDTMGLVQGVILMRYDGSTTPDFPEDEHPRAVTVKIDALGDVLPADTPRLGAKDRAQEIAVRRRHVQQRFGN